MKTLVFSGPSLPPHVIPPIPGLEWRAPIKQGDLQRAIASRPHAVAIVDGYFEITPTVWHDEILEALSRGIRVYGAASIGALRAVEMAPFGMIGVGEVFRAFNSGELEDDEEVAVLHGPPELNFMQLTDAMVDVRATIMRALQVGILATEQAATLIGAAKSLFYKDRSYETVLARAVQAGVPEDVLLDFESRLPSVQVDLKRQDALALLDRLQRDRKAWAADK